MGGGQTKFYPCNRGSKSSDIYNCKCPLVEYYDLYGS